jgi:hypothetical protein
MATFFGGGGGGGIGIGSGNRSGGLTPWMERAVTAALWEAWNLCGDDDDDEEETSEEDDDDHDDLAAVAAANAAATARSARGRRRAGGSSSAAQRLRRSPSSSNAADSAEEDDEGQAKIASASRSAGPRPTAAGRGKGGSNNKKPSPSPPQARKRKTKNAAANKAKLAQVVGVRPDESTVEISDGHVIVTCVIAVEPAAAAGTGAAGTAAVAKKLQATAFLLSSLRRGVMVKVVDWSVARIVNEANEETTSLGRGNDSNAVRLGLQVDEGQIRVVGGYGSAVGGNPVPIAESVEYRRHVQTLVASSPDRFRRAMRAEHMAHVRPVRRSKAPNTKPVPPPLPPPPPPVVQPPQQNAQRQPVERAVSTGGTVAAAAAAAAAASEPLRGEDGVPVGDVAALLGWNEAKDDDGGTNHGARGNNNNKAGEGLLFQPVKLGYPVRETEGDGTRAVRSWREASELFRHVLEHDRSQRVAHSRSITAGIRERVGGGVVAVGASSSSSPTSRIEAPKEADAPPLPTFRPLPEEDDAEEPGVEHEAASASKDAAVASQVEGTLDDDDNEDDVLHDETQPAPSALGLKAMLLDEEESGDDDGASTCSNDGDNPEEENEGDKGRVQANCTLPQGTDLGSDSINGRGRNESQTLPVSSVDDAIEMLLQAEGDDSCHSDHDESGSVRAKDHNNVNNTEGDSGNLERGDDCISPIGNATDEASFQGDGEDGSVREVSKETTAIAGAAESAPEPRIPVDDNEDGDDEAGDEHEGEHDETQKPMLSDVADDGRAESPPQHGNAGSELHETGDDEAEERDGVPAKELAESAASPAPSTLGDRRRRHDDDLLEHQDETQQPSPLPFEMQNTSDSATINESETEGQDEPGAIARSSTTGNELDHSHKSPPRVALTEQSPIPSEDEVRAHSRMRTRRNSLRNVVIYKSPTRTAAQPAEVRRSNRKRVVPRTFTDDFPDAVVTRRRRPESSASGSRDASVASHDNRNRRGKATGDGETSIVTTQRTNQSRPAQVACLPSGGKVPPNTTRAATRMNHDAREVSRTSSPPRGTKRAQPAATDGEEDESMEAFISKFRKINVLFDKWMGWASMMPSDATSQDGSFGKAAAGESRMPGNEILQWLNERGLLSE